MKRSTHSGGIARSVMLGVALGVLPIGASHADGDESRIKQGFAINPVQLNLAGKNRALVGLGSYIVNTGGCNDCHTHPSYAPGGDPFLGQPEQINTAQYLTGETRFGRSRRRTLHPTRSGGLPINIRRIRDPATHRTRPGRAARNPASGDAVASIRQEDRQ